MSQSEHMNETGGWMSPLHPAPLGKAQADQGWTFGHYVELASERTDGKDYAALLFHDAARSVYGIREWLGGSPHVSRIRTLARKIVLRRAHRASLLADDPDLPRIWGRR